MKKKLIVTLAVALCVLTCALSFAGCASSGEKELKAFRQKVVTVLKDNGVNVPNNVQKAKKATVTSTAKYVETNSVADMKNIILDDSSAKSNSGRVDEIRQEMYEQALYIPVVVGDGMVNNHNANSIYDTSVVIEIREDYKAYMEFKLSGSLTTINNYSPAGEGDCAYACSVYLDFESKNNYNFVMLLVYEDGRMGYRYGNAKKQFVYLDYDPQDTNSEIYCSSKVGEGYISQDAKVVKDCFELIKSQFDGMKVEDYNYLTEQKYTIDGQEWLTLCTKYFPGEVE